MKSISQKPLLKDFEKHWKILYDWNQLSCFFFKWHFSRLQIAAVQRGRQISNAVSGDQAALWADASLTKGSRGFPLLAIWFPSDLKSCRFFWFSNTAPPWFWHCWPSALFFSRWDFSRWKSERQDRGKDWSWGNFLWDFGAAWSVADRSRCTPW